MTEVLASTPTVRAEWAVAQAFVDGRFVPTSAPLIPVHNPANVSTQVGSTMECAASDVDEAVRVADRAFAGWASLGAHSRAELMLAAADRIAEALPDLANAVGLEVGKTLADARTDVGGAIHLLRSFAGMPDVAERVTDATGQTGAGAASLVKIHRRPLGPMAVISPWNTPIYLCFNAVAPALISGCTVVVKPPEAAPLALTAALVEAARALPPGVLNVVPGRGPVTGAALTAHPRVRGILFTGGTTAGRQVAASAAETIKKVSMELGGNDPAIVLESAKLSEGMLRELVAGSYAMSGQVCFNIKRIYVHRALYDEFVDKFTALVDQIVVGEAFDSGANIGPLTTKTGYENAQRLLRQARRDGANVHEGGIRAESADWDAGQYIAPTVVTDIAPDAELVLTEQFAPIIPILPFDTDDDAVAEANRTEHGLASSVWSADVTHAERVANRIEAGNTFINVHRIGASVPIVPFGGVKQSGLGRNHGEYAIESCTEDHAIIGFENPSTDLPGIDAWRNLTLDASRRGRQ